MYNDYTFAIIKPNAMRTGKAGPILAMINESGFQIAAMKMIRLTREQAESFYDIHRGKGFFNDLIDFMISSPVIVMILKHDDAVEKFRHLIGNTDPAKAEPGTIRHEFAVSIQQNSVHGSDSPENAAREANFFFSRVEVFGME
ncbi:MAG TPA: nucleoside-diphosphate kinase [Bacteroidales bacterium]|nr:nucleoside-diphosphate kinase [Bacteroidales bacterium]HPT12326.1 nucleoside-diphosphate kinase [Bacteroidales bacterium]